MRYLTSACLASSPKANPMKSAALSRNYSLDAARGVLMTLGAFVHASNIYSVAGDWLIGDGEGIYFFDLVFQSISLFRMPTFFWISGFFCAMTFEYYGSGGLIRKRLPRILVPLVVTWGTLNVAQVCFLAWFRGQDVFEAVSAGVPVYHLWFLIDLMVFIAFASLALPLLKHTSSLAKKTESLTVFPTLIALTLVTFLISAITRSSGMAYEPILQLTSLFRLSKYAPFFIVGVLMYSHDGLRKTFLHVPLITLFIALPTALFVQKFSQNQSIIVRETAHFVEILMAWISVATVLSLFRDLFKNESPLTRFLSDSAYTVYLFHHILVVVVGCALIQYSFDSWLKFLFVCVTSLGFSMLVHMALIRQSHVARFLFNGKSV